MSKKYFSILFLFFLVLAGKNLKAIAQEAHDIQTVQAVLDSLPEQDKILLEELADAQELGEKTTGESLLYGFIGAAIGILSTILCYRYNPYLQHRERKLPKKDDAQEPAGRDGWSFLRSKVIDLAVDHTVDRATSKEKVDKLKDHSKGLLKKIFND